MVNNYNFNLLLLLLLFYFFTLVSSNYSPSFEFKKFDNNSKLFWSQIVLLGDATLVHNGSFVKLTGSWKFSSGSVMFRQPIQDPNPNPTRNQNPRRVRVSFGTYFVYSRSLLPENGVGSESGSLLAFVVHGNGSADLDFRINVSDSKTGFNNGEKLQCWIDFDSSSNRIEVRVSKLGEERPINPSISRKLDLSSLFNDNFYISLTSSSSNNTQICKLYSWSFKLRQVPIWMHSQPLDPQGLKKDAEAVRMDGEPVVMHKRSDCIFRVLTALVFGTGCGALGAFIVLFVCSVLGTKKSGATVQPVVFDCDNVKVIVIEKPDNGKK